MPTTQMNIRIDGELKSEGDLSLAQAGFSPTQAVRLLWACARRTLGAPQGLRELLESLKTTEPKKDAVSEERTDMAEAAWVRRIELYRQFDIPAPARAEVSIAELDDALQAQVDTDKEALEDIYLERQLERGI